MRERERCARNAFTRVVIYFWYHLLLLLYLRVNIVSVSSSRREANTLSFFFKFADCVLFSAKSVRKKRINKRNFITYALGHVDILSVAHDSELGWFSLSFDDDDDLIFEDDAEDDDG